MSRALAAGAAAVVVAVAAVLVSGGETDDPRTPPALPGHPEPFLGTVVVAGDGLAAAIDDYAAIVDVRLPSAAGEPQIDHPSSRQSAGTVDPETGVVLSAGNGRALPLWRAGRVRQAYLPRSNVAVTRARVGGARVTVTDAAAPTAPVLARVIDVAAPGEARLDLAFDFDLGGTPAGDALVALPRGFEQRGDGRRLRCAATPAPDLVVTSGNEDAAARLGWRAPRRLRIELSCSFAGPPPAAPAEIAAAAAADRRWLASGRPLGTAAPPWARRLHDRSLLVLRALADRRSGALAAGLRDRWSYVWPRDAATAVLALAATGHRPEALRTTRFLRRLDLGAAARFRGDGTPVEDGRALQGDAGGWVAAASRAVGLRIPADAARYEWRNRGDYGERAGDTGDYLANAIAAGVPAGAIAAMFGSPRGLERTAGEPGSGLDAAAAWAVRPFNRPALRERVRSSLIPLIRDGGRFGIEPAEDWPGEDPWTAPTAWTAWSFAALGDRRRAEALLAALRRAATPTGALPERADARTGVPRSTTPLGWSHAFAVLALRELFPSSAPIRQASPGCADSRPDCSPR